MPLARQVVKDLAAEHGACIGRCSCAAPTSTPATSSRS